MYVAGKGTQLGLRHCWDKEVQSNLNLDLDSTGMVGYENPRPCLLVKLEQPLFPPFPSLLQQLEQPTILVLLWCCNTTPYAYIFTCHNQMSPSPTLTTLWNSKAKLKTPKLLPLQDHPFSTVAPALCWCTLKLKAGRMQAYHWSQVFESTSASWRASAMST